MRRPGYSVCPITIRMIATAFAMDIDASRCIEEYFFVMIESGRKFTNYFPFVVHIDSLS